MESRSFLRLWEQSDWPRDDFTIAENREDLEKLETRHRAGISFCYTVMTLEEDRCLGCVYLLPGDAPAFRRSKITSLDGSAWDDSRAALHFWVRQSEMERGLDRWLLHTLGDWLRDAWRFEAPLFVTSEYFEQQVDMVEAAGLMRRFRISDPQTGGAFLAYGFQNRENRLDAKTAMP